MIQPLDGRALVLRRRGPRKATTRSLRQLARPTALGLAFSEVARHGDLLFLSGMVGIEPGTTDLVSGGVKAETRRALANVRLMLAEVGASPEDVLRCTVMLEDTADFERFNAVFTDFFDEPLPARSTFGVDGLALGAAVEIECVAAARKP